MSDTAGKIDGMRRAAQIFLGSAMMMDENPKEMVSRGQMASTLRDIAAELERQAALLEAEAKPPPERDEAWYSRSDDIRDGRDSGG